METFIVGTCDAMCPTDEIRMRTQEKLLHFFERMPSNQIYYIADETKVVKEFSRSAAGIRVPKPKDLRTPQALKQTIEYLLNVILLDARKPFNVVYDFIFDRLRAVRQEIVMQNFPESLTIELLEPIVMFLAYSLYRLVEEPINKFDPKICRQHLQECLKKVLACYDELDASNKAYNSINRETIESLYLVFNLGNAEALTRAIKIPKLSHVRGKVFRESLKISLAYWNKNLYKCLTSIPKLPNIICAIASLHLQNIRRDILNCFSVAYQNKVLTVPLEWLSTVLIYNSIEKLAHDCKYYGIQVDLQNKCVKFAKAELDQTKATIKSCHETFVNNQFKIQIGNILLFKN